jgi:hypothetical protein
MAGAGSLKPASAKGAVASEAATDGGAETFGTGGAGHSAEAGSGKAPKMNFGFGRAGGRRADRHPNAYDRQRSYLHQRASLLR